METLFTITTQHGGQYFALFYTIAFIFALTFFLVAGFRRKYPKLVWFLITLSAAFFFILGNKLFTCTPDEWLLIFTKLQFPETTGKTILGGLIGLVFGLFLASRLLNFRKPVFDKLAIALPIAMAIQRVGCLLGGCCFGTPTSLPWAIKYGPDFMAYNAHLHYGHIHLNDPSSIAVHPTQLYQVIGCLLIAFIVWRMKKYWKASGNLFLFSVLLYAGFRFSIEFLYDPIANGEAGIIIWGLKYVQWAVAIAILLIGSIILIRERRFCESNIDFTFNSRHLLRSTFLTIMFIIVSGIFSLWFDGAEKLIIWIILIPTIVLLFVNVFKCLTSPNLRWLTVIMLFCSLILSSQSKSLYDPKGKKITYTEISVGSMSGAYYNAVRDLKLEWVPPDPCNLFSTGHYNRTYGPNKPRKHTFTTVGGEISHNRILKKATSTDKLKVGLGIYLTNEKEVSTSSYDTIPVSERYRSLDVNPFFQYDWKLIGLRVGFHAGEIRYADKVRNEDIDGGELNNIKTHNVIPELGIRVFPYEYFYFKYEMSGHFPLGAPLFSHKIGLGSGLGKYDKSQIEAGVGSGGILYFQARIQFKDRYNIEACYASDFLPEDPLKYTDKDERVRVSHRRMLSLAFKYRFNYKPKYRKK